MHLPSRSSGTDGFHIDDGPVLITGGAGYIGSALVERLNCQGFDVRVLDLPGVDVLHLPRSVDVRRGDVTKAADVAEAVRGCAAVMHLAGNPNLYHADATTFERVNHHGTRRVLEAAAAAGVKRIVHCSTESILALPDPEGVADEQTQLPLSAMFGPYLRSKWRAEEAAREAAAAGLPVIIVNPSVPIGPGDRHGVPLSRMIVQLVRGRIKGFLPGTINVIDVRDLATAMSHALTRGRIGERYLLAGHNLTYEELFATVAKVAGITPPTWRVPYPLALAFAAVEEWWCRCVTGATPLATIAGIRLTRRSFQFNATRSSEELSWSLRSVEESLNDMLAWLIERGEIAGPVPLSDPGME